MDYKKFRSLNPQEYHRLLIVHAKDILEDTNKRNQGLVAKDLNITQSKLSNILPLLKELYYANN